MADSKPFCGRCLDAAVYDEDAGEYVCPVCELTTFISNDDGPMYITQFMGFFDTEEDDDDR